MDVLGSAELCQLLGVNRQRLAVLSKRPEFPAPVARLTMGAVWQLNDIVQFAQQTGRHLNPDHASSALENRFDASTGLVGSAEIAVLLGVSRQRISQLAQSAEFPAPVAQLTMGAVWQLDDIAHYARRTGRHLESDAAAS